MSLLTEPLEDVVIFGGRRYLISAHFNRVLEVQRLFREKELPDMLKTKQALSMLVENRRSIKWLPIKKKEELLQLIFEICIDTQKRPERRKDETPVLDFEYDAEYIYASFMLDYGIDLVDEQERLHWKKFISLFNGLSERTKIREVMRIRAMEIPKFTGKNAEQIRNIQDLKSYYALPVKGGGGADGLNKLFDTLERMAKSG